ncbi:glycoside hydrolase family 65 protein [Citricoccus sp.]|uniref:glycoside hydrolase family 65 protein n=1 Tax=Citricoccus sp. TaxID=1978372 RepID=UPI002625F5C5|nr:glycosyl hydrolase family 65 protein [Citricoccus sp.]HRO30288.1 glycosyl hydrolase family 65 protein [Citricoccus sp.]HRO93094.1 glycosyl hydrolase family 65 protein [Citricoccus sp.]
MATPSFTIGPWQVRETGLDLEALGVAESVFALGNGHIGLRGALEETQPSVSRGTFLSGVHEHHPLAYPEGGYGAPERGEAIIGVADGAAIRVQVDGAALDVRETPPEDHERVLDLRAGTLERRTEWTTPGGRRMRLRSTRLVSLAHRCVTATRWRLEAVDGPARVIVTSDLVVNGIPPQVDNPDPRVGEVLGRPFEALADGRHRTGGHLVHRTRSSRIRVAAAVDHAVRLPGTAAVPESAVSTDGDEDRVTTTIVAELAAGETLELVKVTAHAWSGRDPGADQLDLARAALAEAVDRGWPGLVADQREVLDVYWEDADIEVDGDPELQDALRFALFQVLQAAAGVHDAPVGAKGLTGSGYSGHTFWDIDGFLMPVLTLLRPRDAARLLRWRASGLDRARERARALDLPGAAFPWRTISGRETSAYWPASTAAMHLNADIARSFRFWADSTGRPLTEIGGVDVLVESARLWTGLAHHDHGGAAHLLGLTGPDEYTGVVDDNVFTVLMARWNLRAAAGACAAHAQDARRLGVADDEPRRWLALAAALHVPYDAALGVHPANEGFTTYREWDFEEDPGPEPLQEHTHYLTLYRHQVVKQADLVQALWWCPEEFTAEQAARNVDYYERRTVRDSSLSAAVQSVACARVGHLDLAVAYLREAALVDLRDLQDDTHQGLHLASLAGAWLALVSGLGGLHVDGDELRLAPRLPARLGRLCFRFRFRGRRLRVEVTPEGTTLALQGAGHDDAGPSADAGPLPVIVDGAEVTVEPDRPVTVPLTVDEPLLPVPVQPPGRAPTA